MGARRWIGWMAGLVPALLAGAHLVLAPAAAPAGGLALQSPTIISSPRESLPPPIHDEATCAFCQAAAFAPHSSRAVGAFTIAAGGEQRIQLAQDNVLPPSTSATPTRSRGPPVIRFV